MARPLSEEKKQALLTAATHAIAQLGISASTAIIAKKAEVAEGTLFRYFPTKDALFNALYLHLKKSLCSAIMNELVVDSDPKQLSLIHIYDFIFNILSRISLNYLRYCSSVTCSIQSTTLPFRDSAIAICVIAVSAVAPCQCLTPSGIQTISPGLIS